MISKSLQFEFVDVSRAKSQATFERLVSYLGVIILPINLMLPVLQARHVLFMLLAEPGLKALGVVRSIAH
jgi:hypothetical protein